MCKSCFRSSDKQEEVLIAGGVCRNRGVHGDLVAVQLLPKSEWKSKLNRLSKQKEGEEGKSGDGEETEAPEEKWERRADVCPTGKVVAIIARFGSLMQNFILHSSAGV